MFEDLDPEEGLEEFPSQSSITNVGFLNRPDKVFPSYFVIYRIGENE